MLLSVSPEILLMLKEILLVLVGGACAAFGGFVSMWYHAKKARKIRREEVIGEKQVEVYQQAAGVASNVQSKLIQDTLEGTLQYVQLQGEWFWKNRLLLPQGFQNKWISLKSNLRKAVRMEKGQEKQKDEDKREEQINTLVELQSFLDQLAGEAEKEILKELGLSLIEIEKFYEKEES